MRLWTVQPLDVWEQLQQKSHLHVEEDRLPYDGYIPDTYRWLVRKLIQRIPDYPGTLPWWAHCEKPDLRWVRHRRPRGRQFVRLELEPLPGSFATIPSWGWNTVFGGYYLAPTREEHDQWMAALRNAVPDEDTWPLPEPWQSELEASWERLFDPDLPPIAWDECLGTATCREGVLGLLRLEDVRRVTTFVGCSTWK